MPALFTSTLPNLTAFPLRQCQHGSLQDCQTLQRSPCISASIVHFNTTKPYSVPLASVPAWFTSRLPNLTAFPLHQCQHCSLQYYQTLQRSPCVSASMVHFNTAKPYSVPLASVPAWFTSTLPNLTAFPLHQCQHGSLQYCQTLQRSPCISASMVHFKTAKPDSVPLASVPALFTSTLPNLTAFPLRQCQHGSLQYCQTLQRSPCISASMVHFNTTKPYSVPLASVPAWFTSRLPNLTAFPLRQCQHCSLQHYQTLQRSPCISASMVHFKTAKPDSVPLASVPAWFTSRLPNLTAFPLHQCQHGSLQDCQTLQRSPCISASMVHFKTAKPDSVPLASVPAWFTSRLPNLTAFHLHQCQHGSLQDCQTLQRSPCVSASMVHFNTAKPYSVPLASVPAWFTSRLPNLTAFPLHQCQHGSLQDCQTLQRSPCISASMVHFKTAKPYSVPLASVPAWFTSRLPNLTAFPLHQCQHGSLQDCQTLQHSPCISASMVHFKTTKPYNVPLASTPH